MDPDELLRDIKRARETTLGKVYLKLDPRNKRLLEKIAAYYEKEFPEFLAKAREQVFNRNLTTRIDRMLEFMAWGRKLALALSGTTTAPSEEEMQAAIRLFPQLERELDSLLEDIHSDQALKQRIQQALPDVDIDKQLFTMEQASRVTTKTIAEAKRTKPGLVQKAKERLEPAATFLGGVGEHTETLYGTWGKKAVLGDVGLRSVLGPFASIAAGAITGTYKGLGALEERRKKKREAREREMWASLSYGEAADLFGEEYAQAGVRGRRGRDWYEEPGTIRGEGWTAKPGRAARPGREPWEQLGAGRGGRGAGISGADIRNIFGYIPAKKGKGGRFESLGADISKIGGGITAGVTAATIAGGLFLFFNKTWKDAYWTKRVLQLLGEKGTPGAMVRPKSLFDTLIDKMGGILANPATWEVAGGLIAAAVAAYFIKTDIEEGAKKAEEWGISPTAAKVGAALAGPEPGLGEKGFSWWSVLKGQIKGLGAGYLIGGTVGAIGGAIGGALAGGVGAIPGAIAGWHGGSLLGAQIGSVAGTGAAMIGGRRVGVAYDFYEKVGKRLSKGAIEGGKPMEPAFDAATKATVVQHEDLKAALDENAEKFNNAINNFLTKFGTPTMVKSTPHPRYDSDDLKQGANRGGLHDLYDGER